MQIIRVVVKLPPLNYLHDRLLRPRLAGSLRCSCRHVRRFLYTYTMGVIAILGTITTAAAAAAALEARAQYNRRAISQVSADARVFFRTQLEAIVVGTLAQFCKYEIVKTL